MTSTPGLRGPVSPPGALLRANTRMWSRRHRRRNAEARVMDLRLAGAVALVTGAGGGVGKATAHRLACEGAAVSLVEITEPGQAYHAVQDTRERLGRLDILVNSGSVMLLDTALHTPIEDWDRMISVNVTAL